MSEEKKETRGSKPKFKTKKAVKKIIDKYFEETEEKGKIPSMSGLARRLGLSRMSLWRYRGSEKFREILEDAKDRIIESIEDQLLNTKANANLIFVAKQYGFTDKIIEEHSTSNKLHELLKKGWGFE